MELRTYDLLDAALMKNDTHPYDVMVWRPDTLCIVLGQSNKMETSIHAETVIADRIPVYKRPSGGETVVLSPRTLVISVVKRGEGFRAPGLYFKEYNRSIIRGLKELGVRDLRTDGISDICIGHKKILGSSIYRGKDLVFYHAVLNVSESVETISRYLQHPPREPGYRQGRSHRDFVTSLSEQGYAFSFDQLKKSLAQSFPR